MSITLGEVITSLLNWVGITSTIALWVALGIYIMRRVFQVSIENTYIIEDNSFCPCDEESDCCSECPMNGKCWTSLKSEAKLCKEKTE